MAAVAGQVHPQHLIRRSASGMEELRVAAVWHCQLHTHFDFLAAVTAAAVRVH